MSDSILHYEFDMDLLSEVLDEDNLCEMCGESIVDSCECIVDEELIKLQKSLIPSPPILIPNKNITVDPK